MSNIVRSIFVLLLLAYAGGASAGDNEPLWTDDDASRSASDAGQSASKSSWTMGILPVIPDEGAGTTILSNQQYVIGPSDELEVEVFQVPDLSGIERVNARGYINMPLIGLVLVAGLTGEEAEQLIAEKLAKDYLQDPQVNIDIKDYVSQQVTVLGAVKAPGVYPLKGPTTLLQVIAFAGGPGAIADEESIVVFRADSSGAIVGYVVNLKEIQTGQKQDPRVVGNDRVVVPDSGSRAFLKGVTDTLRGFVGFAPL